MGALQSISYRNIRGTYFLDYERRTQASWVQVVANMVKTDQPLEVYKWLKAAPNMKKWAGERTRQKLGDQGLTIVNDKYESTIEVDIDDLQMDKTGQIMNRVRDLSAKAATLPERLLTTLLVANGTSYDGTAFFASSHTASTVDNLHTANITDPAAPTAAEMSAAIMTLAQGMFAALDENGDPMNGDMQELALMVPVKYWGASIAALQNEFTASGVSNTLKNAGMKFSLHVNPRLTADSFYGFRADAGVRALLFQERDIDDAFKTLGADSEHGFWKDTVAFGVKRVGAAALGRFELAARHDFT